MSNDRSNLFDLNDRPADEAVKEIGPGPDVDLHTDPLAPSGAIIEAPIRQWRVAKALEHLCAQVNAAFPGRSKASDGTIGDAAHASRSSDHNPWVVDGGVGVVTAFDLTNDPASGCDAGRIAETLRRSGDSRIKYIIWNRRITNSKAIGGAPAWAWRAYSGANPHNHHCHISVRPEKAAYDDASDWKIRGDMEMLEAASDFSSEVLFSNALDALPGDRQESTLQRLVDAQDVVAGLLSALAAETRVRAIDLEEAPAPSFVALKAEYGTLWNSCKIPSTHASEVAWHREKLLKYRPRYEQVAAAANAPWWFIGIVHAMEASFNFQGHLHNGDPLTARTVNIPPNRPPVWNPPTDWQSSAVDAITFEGYANQQDWSLARVLFRFEGYNGYSYHTKGINSPYLWSFSNHYAKGKYVRDKVYDPNAVSKQCGAAVMLKALEFAGVVKF